jgi:long-chain fatty acid transport protein
MPKFTILLLIFVIPASLAMAAGFSIGEFGGRAAAMGNAVTAQAYDASTLFYNPAGLGFLEGTHFYGNVTIISPSAKFVGADPLLDNTVYDANEQIFPPVGIYAAHKFNEKFGAGISLTNPFGLGLAWRDDFPGRFISKDALLESYYITPTVAYQITPELSVAAGLDIVIARLNLKRDVLLFNTTGVPGTGTEVGSVELAGSAGPKYGFTTGIMYRKERFGLGFMYRHSIEVSADDGDATFTILNNLDPATAAIAGQILVDQKVAASLNLPNYFVAGVYYKINEQLGVEIDYAWYGWSIFDEIVLEFDDPALNQTIPENYVDEYQLRFGAHYELNEQFSIRAGFIYDRTPQPIESVSPLLPDDTRNDYSIGLGYKTGRFTLDGGYMYVDIGERSTVEDGVGMNDNGFNGSYISHAHLFYFSVGYTIK